MTFIPNVLSNIDSNNSISGLTASFVGIYSSTIGYNTIQLNITSNNNSNPCGIIITFSPDQTNITATLTDTYFSGSNFNKRYNILDKYYKISYTPSTTSSTTITSRLCTDSLNNMNNSLNAFDNNNEYKLDAFGKLRISEPNTLLDIKFPYTYGGITGSTGFLSNTTQLSLGTTGISGYTGSYGTGNGRLYMTVSGNGNYVCQSRNYCTYQPGKSLLFTPLKI
jgi:hypothetical protein